MSRLLAPGCRDNHQCSTRVSSSLHVFLFLACSPSHFCYLHRRFPATDAAGYPPAGVCVAENQRHTEDTRIQAGQIKRRLPGIIRNVARRGARTNQAASLFSAPEPAFLFSLSLFSFFSFPLSPFLFFSFFFFFNYSATIGANGARDAVNRAETRNFAQLAFFGMGYNVVGFGLLEEAF